MGEQRPDDVGVTPMLGVGRQAEAGSVRRGVGPAEIALGPHVEQPPRQPVAMQGRAVGLHHDEAFRADGDERAEGLDLPFVVDAEDRRNHDARPAPLRRPAAPFAPFAPTASPAQTNKPPPPPPH